MILPADKLIEIAENEQKIYQAGIEQGGKSFYDEFWDNFLNRTNLQQTTACLFAGAGWSEETFNPPYYLDFLTDGYQMFVYCSYISKEKLAMIDYSKMNRLQGAFNSTKLIELPIIDARGATTLSSMCAWSSKLVSVEKIILKDDGSQIVTYIFQNCISLENVEIEGTIGQNGFDIHWSTQLTKDSIKSIINALSTTANDLTVKLSKTAVNNAFTTDEWNTLEKTRPNWKISLE